MLDRDEGFRVCDEDRHVICVHIDRAVQRMSSNLYVRQAILQYSYKWVKTQGERDHTVGAILSYPNLDLYAPPPKGPVYLNRRRCLVIQVVYALYKPCTGTIPP